MIKILANDGIHPDGKKAMEDAGFIVDTNKIAQADLATKLNDYDAIVVRSATKVRQELIDQCPNLKAIARGGVGLDNIDVDYAKSKNIPVYNTPAASSTSVAELVFGHMFNLSRSLHLSNQAMPKTGDSEFKNLKKAYAGGMELRGKTLGIIGIGRIGQEVARIGLAMGMNVMPVDTFVKEKNISINLFESETIGLSVKIKSVPMEDMLVQADYLTLHIPFSGGSAIIGSKELAMMKDSAIIINAARGGAVDEDALYEALTNGKIAGAGLDVFVNEPTPRMDLIKLPNVSSTPHIGAATHGAQRNIGLELAEKLIAFFNQ